MGAKGYTPAQMAEAVALAAIAGADAAGKQRGIQPDTIRNWSGKARDRPELDGEAGHWSRLQDLAHAKTAAMAAEELSV